MQKNEKKYKWKNIKKKKSTKMHKNVQKSTKMYTNVII